LEARQREIDDLNVFPVADGDTGRNMVLTLRGLVGAMEALRVSIGPVDLEEVDRDLVVRAVARAALSSAHGNSGVILSQLIRGAARELGSGRGRKVSPHLLGRAMRAAAEQVFASIPEPREGTMLTVARDIAEALEQAWPEPVAVDEAISPGEQDALLAEALEIAVAAGTASVDRGPELLDVLRERGVVDAGGYGLVVMLAGALAALRGDAEVDLPHRRPAAGPVTESNAPGRFTFCVNFTLTGVGLDPPAEAGRLTAAGIGDSVLVVGDSEMIRVHVHTDVPAEARALFEPLGTIEHFEQEDMTEQVRDRDRRLARRSAVVVLGHDPGSGELFESELVSAASVDHVSPAEAMAALGLPEVVLVATSPRSLELAAEAVLDGGVRAEVVDGSNLGAALLALSAVDGLDGSDGAALNAERIRAVLDSLETAGIRAAPVADGPAEAVLGGEVIASGEPAGLITQLAERFAPGSFVTAVIDPGAPLTVAMLDALIAEVDVSTAALGEWHCVFALER